MFSTLSYVDASSSLYTQAAVAKAKQHYSPKDVGNDIPAGWRQITEEELVRTTGFHSQVPVLLERRSFPVTINGGKTYHMSVEMQHFHDGTGIGMVVDFWNAPHVLWFAFGCKHEYEATSSRGFLHTSTCTKCGHIHTVDSSD